MCLSRVDKVYKNPLKKTILAWKGFTWITIGGGGVLPWRRLKNGSSILPPGKWVKASGTKIWSSSGSYYPAGFHVPVTKNGAKKWGRPLRVKVRGIVAIGRQGKFKILIAKEIYLIRIVK